MSSAISKINRPEIVNLNTPSNSQSQQYDYEISESGCTSGSDTDLESGTQVSKSQSTFNAALQTPISKRPYKMGPRTTVRLELDAIFPTTTEVSKKLTKMEEATAKKHPKIKPLIFAAKVEAEKRVFAIKQLIHAYATPYEFGPDEWWNVYKFKVEQVKLPLEEIDEWKKKDDELDVKLNKANPQHKIRKNGETFFDKPIWIPDSGIKNGKPKAYNTKLLASLVKKPGETFSPSAFVSPDAAYIDELHQKMSIGHWTFLRKPDDALRGNVDINDLISTYGPLPSALDIMTVAQVMRVVDPKMNRIFGDKTGIERQETLSICQGHYRPVYIGLNSLENGLTVTYSTKHPAKNYVYTILKDFEKLSIDTSEVSDNKVVYL